MNDRLISFSSGPMGQPGQIIPRVIFIGDSGVGKTSLIIRGKSDTFTGITTPTVGAGVTPMRRMVDGQELNFHIWDTAGQEIYRSIVPLYFKLAVCAIVVFSLNDVKSFDALPSWIDMLQRNTDRDVPVVIAGNKSDLEDATVDLKQAKSWAESNNYPIFFTSAATGENVRTLFDSVAASYVSTYLLDSCQVIPKVSQGGKKCCS
jgi:small GTP-binding protein